MDSNTKMLSNNRIISKSKLREYRDAFSLFDKDGNGFLTKEELGHVMHKVVSIN
jgi:Ca2+-binding EF-hand superfamily protein